MNANERKCSRHAPRAVSLIRVYSRSCAASLFVAVALIAGVACAAPNVTVTQYYKQKTCSLTGGCKVKLVGKAGDGCILGRGEDGRLVAITGAKYRAKGIAFVDVQQNEPQACEGEVLAVNKDLDVALVAFRHVNPLPATQPGNISSPLRQWVAIQLGGNFPVPDPPAGKMVDVEDAAPARESEAPAEPKAAAEALPPKTSRPATQEDLRNILQEEFANALPDIKKDLAAETKKLLAAHGDDLKEAVLAQVQQGKLDPTAFKPILEGVAKTAGEDLASNVTQKIVPQVLPGLLKGIAAHLGTLPMLGAIGGPIGLLAGGAVSVVGFFINRTLKKNVGVPPSGGARPAASAPPAPSAAAPAVNVIQTQPPEINIPADSRFEDLVEALNREIPLNSQFASTVQRAYKTFESLQQGRAVAAAKS